MKRSWILAPMLVLLLVGCGQKSSAQPSSSSAKTVITSKQYTTTQLQARYTKLVDAVVKPLEMASYSKTAAQIHAQAKQSQTIVETVRLQLAANNSQVEQTKALKALAASAKAMLTAMTGSNQAAYNAAAKTFMDQTGTIAKTYYGGKMPQSLITYSARMQKTASSSASRSSTN